MSQIITKSNTSRNLPVFLGKHYQRQSKQHASVISSTSTSTSTSISISNQQYELQQRQRQLHQQRSFSNYTTSLSTQQGSLFNSSCSCRSSCHDNMNNSSSTTTARSYAINGITALQHRSYSSSTIQCMNNNNNTTNTSSSNTTAPTETTELSEVSSDDLKLVMDVANQDNNNSNSTNITNNTNPTSLNLNNIPGTSTSASQKGRVLAIVYTCNICGTRSAKKFTERAYHHGVVLVRCPNCESLHLIADRLGYFPDDDDDYNSDSSGDNGGSGSERKGWDIEMFMKKIGQEENIKVMTGGGDGNDDGVFEVVTVEDMLGKGFMDDITNGGTGNSSSDGSSSSSDGTTSGK
jgi:hypothetical protein